MSLLRTFLLAVLLVFSISSAQLSFAKEPSDRELIEDLSREIQELRRTVAELTRRLEGQEFGQLPRLESMKARPEVRLRPEEEVPKNFRFPINIERGTAAPVGLGRRAWVR